MAGLIHRADQSMERLLKKNFKVESKNPTQDALSGWRSAVWLVKNPVRRFRMVADFAKRSQTERNRRISQIREALTVQTEVQHFIDASNQAEYTQPELSAIQAGFEIEPNILASLVLKRDLKELNSHGGLEGIADKLNVSLREGISSTFSEISRRKRAYGFNCFIEKTSKPFTTFVWEALHDFTLIILMICAVIFIGLGKGNGMGIGMYDGVGILLFILLMVIVTAGSDYTQSLQFVELDKEKKKSITVQVTRDGRIRQKVSICDLVVGDIVHLSIGDQVPADGLFISGHSLTVDESNLSVDESAPVINISKNNPFLLSGAKVQDGSGKMLVASVCLRTKWGRTMEDENETPLQVKLNGVATVIGKIGLGFSILTFVFLLSWFFISRQEFGNWSRGDGLTILNFFAIAVIMLVIAIPEGLPLAVTLSLAFATKRLTKEKAIVRRLSALETMGIVSCICTDKTGTLTTNQMSVTKLWMIRGEAKSINTEAGISALKSSLSKNSIDIMLQSIFQNTSAEIVRSKVSGTPTETSLMEFALQFKHENWTGGEIVKIEPFNSVKKTMSVLVNLPNGESRVFCKGASEIVLRMSDKIINENGEPIPLTEDNRKKIMNVINEFAHQSLRTVCLAFKDMNKENELKIPDDQYTLVAVIGIKDPVRPGIKEAVRICVAAGIKVRIVTGDSLNTAIAIARECGILTEDGLAIEAHDIRDKSPEELKTILPKLQVMARSLPMDKHKLVTHLRKELEEVVAVTGDDINDVPALQEADIGLAMGISGTEVAKENADIVIMDDNFTTIVNVARWGRSVYVNIQKFVLFHLMDNVLAVLLIFMCACISGSTTLTVVQLLWVNMIMDTLGALALATEPPCDELMERPPIRREGSFITKRMWRHIFVLSNGHVLMFLCLKYCGKILLEGNYDFIFNTFIFNAFVFAQVFHMIGIRYMLGVNAFAGFSRSWKCLAVITSTVLFQVIIVQYLGNFVGATSLSLYVWLLSLLFAVYNFQFMVHDREDMMPMDQISKTTLLPHQDYEPLPSGPDLA